MPSSDFCTLPHKIPIVPAVFELDPEIWFTYLMCQEPAEPLTNGFFCFVFRQIFGVLGFFWDVFVLRDPTFSVKKKKKHS